MPNTTLHIIRDVLLAYPKLNSAQPNQFGVKQFEVRLDFPSSRMVELAEFSRQPARPCDVADDMLSINVRLPEFNAKGKANSVPVTDMRGNALSPTEVMEMGNGTKANIIVLKYEKDGKFYTQLRKVQVIEYKKYELDSIDFDIIDDTKTEFSNQF